MDPITARLNRAIADAIRPDPVLTVSEWADRYRMLGSESARASGKYRTDKTPYIREPLDCLSAHHPCERVVVMKGSQVGFTEAGLNWIGYVVHCVPGPMMVVYPTVELAEDTSKDRIMPMLTSTPRLAELVLENKSRASGNTILEKKFRGGLLKISGANSAVMLRSKPIRYLFFDEVDGFPEDVDGEGDPVALAIERTNTFSKMKKIALVSTPTIKGHSRIEKSYLASDQRRYYLTCPACGHADYLMWRADDGHHYIAIDEKRPETARMACRGCGERIEERHKPALLEAGEWRPTAAGDGVTRGYHLSGLYSPLGWLSWQEIAERFLKAKDDPSLLKVWVNTSLGETWEESGDSLEGTALLLRREEYEAEVPWGVGILVCSVDVQDDRLEWKVIGYGADEESWLIATAAIQGDPALESVWHELDEVLTRDWDHASGRKMRVEATAVDTGGHRTDFAYKFCRARFDRRVFAIRGGNIQGVPLVTKPTRSNAYRIPLWSLCTDTGKDTIYARLRIGRPPAGVSQPGYMHLPQWVTEDYVDQLTSERGFRKYIRGRGSVRVWTTIKGRRNEQIDLEVYALAALHILWPDAIRLRNLRARADAMAKLRDRPPGDDSGGPSTSVSPAPPPVPPAPAPRPPISRRGGWVKGWRDR